MESINDYVILDINDGIASLKIDYPPLNTLSIPVMNGLSCAVEHLKVENPRILIITGQGNSFAAGGDLDEFIKWDPETAIYNVAKGQRLMDEVENLPFPVIAAINGYALGGGLELALACDIRIAATNAVFALPETKIGIIPGYGGTQRLLRTINVGYAKKMIYTGEQISAETALRMELIQELAPEGELMDAAIKLAGQIRDNAPLAMRHAKKAVNALRTSTMPYGMAEELKGVQVVFTSRDKQEGMTAFKEKRKAQFQGV